MTTVTPPRVATQTHTEFEHTDDPDVCHRLNQMGVGICGHGTYGVPTFAARRTPDGKCADCGLQACPDCEGTG